MHCRRLRVLLHPFFFLAEAWNGMDEHLWLLSKYLDQERYDVLVLCHASDGPQTLLLSERAGIRAISAPYPPGANALFRLRALRALYASARIDLLHLHSPVAGGQAVPALAARLAGVAATLATYHQVQPVRLAAKSRALNYVTHSLLIDRTLAVSRGVRDSLVTATGLPRQRLQVVHNGIEPPEANARPSALPARMPGEVRIGYFGRLSPEKGLPCLLEALARLASRCPQARTLIVGEGPERAELEVRTRGLGIGDRVQFLGFRPDARQIMEQVDIVIHAPVYEGFGLVVLEAMAAGRPVVANDAPGGLTEIVVPGETGLIAPAGCPDALAAALARLSTDPAERRRLGQNGRVRWEQHFSARVMVERVVAIYEEALGERRKGRNWVVPERQLLSTG